MAICKGIAIATAVLAAIALFGLFRDSLEAAMSGDVDGGTEVMLTRVDAVGSITEVIPMASSSRRRCSQ